MLVLTGILLAGCETSTSPVGQLPTVPADIQTCFRKGAGVLPDKALTVFEVESLWKQDRVRIAVMQRCGNRMIAWYNELRAGWK